TSAGWRPWVIRPSGQRWMVSAVRAVGAGQGGGRREGCDLRICERGRPARHCAGGSGGGRTGGAGARGRGATEGASAHRTDGAGHAAEVDVPPTHQGDSSSRHGGSLARRSGASPASS